MTDDIAKVEEEGNNLHRKKRHGSVCLDSSLESTSKKQKLHSLSENGDFTLPDLKKKQKKSRSLDNSDVDHETEITHVECWTSTPIETKRKHSSLDFEGRGELQLNTGKDVITNKASKSGKSFPFFTELLNRLNQRVSTDKEGNVSESMESVSSAGKSKKRKKKKRSMSDISWASTEPEEVAKNDSGSTSYTIDVYDSQSEVHDGSFVKKNKKKEKDLVDENRLGTDFERSQTCSESESGMKKKKKKKKEKHEHFNIEDSFTSDFSVGSNNQNVQQDGNFIHKKKKKKHKRKLSFGECSSLSEGENKQNNREESIQKNTNGEINCDQISSVDKKIRKRSKSESSSVFEEKHKVRKSSTNQNGDINEKVEAESPKKAHKSKDENTSDFIKSEKQSPEVAKHKKKKRKKDLPIRLLLSDYKIKYKAKHKGPKRTHSALLDKSGEECKKNIEKKPQPFETSNLSLVDLLKDIKDKSRLGDEEKEKLKKLDVLLPWPIPPLHLIETRVAGRPTENNKQAIEALQIKVKTGKFSKSEDEQIRSNWKMFYKMHDLPKDPTPFLSFATPDRKITIPAEARISFVRFLAHGLDNRLLCSVYNRFKRLFFQKKVNSGRFTPSEDKAIVKFLRTSSSSTPFSDLAKLLNRDKLAVEKRCSKLAVKAAGSDSRIQWDKNLIEEFMKHLFDVTDIKNLEELKSGDITPEQWKEMSSRLNIPVKKLRQAWDYSLYSRVFVKERLYSKDVKEKLIERLIEREEDDWRSVNWKEIAQEFEGFTAHKLNRMVKELVSYHVPSRLQNDLKASLNYLRDKPLKMNILKGQKIKRLKILDKRGTE